MPNETFHVRPETPADHAAIHAVHAEAFGQPDEADLVDALRHNCAEEYRGWVARDGDTVVGHVAFTPVALEADEAIPGMGLAPLGVLKAYQRRGIGRLLARTGLDALRAEGCNFVVVLGDPAYYTRFGFAPASRLGIRCIWDVPEDAFMIRVFDHDELRGRSGVCHYRPEFGSVA